VTFESFAKKFRQSCRNGDTQVVLKALDRIGDGKLKDFHAEKSAYKLHKAGQQSGAVEVAKTMSSGTSQNSVLSNLARGITP
jgi:hypothetical protein